MKNLAILCGLLALTLSAGAMADLDGTWVSDCIKNGNQYHLGTYTVAGTNVDQVVDIHADAQCSKYTVKVEMTATVKFGPDSQILAGAREMDTIVSKLYVTPLDEKITGYLNTAKFCGDADWATGSQKDITGKTCGQETMPKTGDEHYDIYSVLQNGKLLQGKTSKEYDGKTLETRVRELDSEHPLTKK